jgi:hypothetical protein
VVIARLTIWTVAFLIKNQKKKKIDVYKVNARRILVKQLFCDERTNDRGV